MRGKEDLTMQENLKYRITPAYAGKSLAEFGKTSKAWDHPRLCGEKVASSVYSQTFPGSPPPMRGKESRTAGRLEKCRITPAYAGKSQIVVNLVCGKQDHPRLCGEKHMEVYAICDIIGSPPPMRGKVKEHFTGAYNARITPAYAGKRHANPDAVFRHQDHPRLCGEKRTKL